MRRAVSLIYTVPAFAFGTAREDASASRKGALDPGHSIGGSASAKFHDIIQLRFLVRPSANVAQGHRANNTSLPRLGVGGLV